MSAALSAAASDGIEPHGGRRTLVLILGLFVLPVLIAAGLFFFGWRPGRTINHGELIQPPMALPDQGLTGADGRPIGGAELRGKWLLVLAGSGPCDESCRGRLKQMRSVQVALNQDRDRVRRAWINPAASKDPALPELRRALPDLVVAQPDGNAWTAVFGSAPGHRLFLADPMGNVMMRYRDNADPQGVRKDLERLLKYSWIG